jgi:hypothetical protein
VKTVIAYERVSTGTEQKPAALGRGLDIPASVLARADEVIE